MKFETAVSYYKVTYNWTTKYDNHVHIVRPKLFWQSAQWTEEITTKYHTKERKKKSQKFVIAGWKYYSRNEKKKNK